MKCRDCEHWGWGDDEGTPVWGWCWIRTSCPDPDIERTCPAFSPKAPDIFTALSTLQAENEKLRADLEQVKAERDAAVEKIREWEKFDTYLLIHNFITPEKWRGQKED